MKLKEMVISTLLFGTSFSSQASVVTFDGSTGGHQIGLGSSTSYTENGLTIIVPSTSWLFLDPYDFGYGATPNGSDHAQIDGGSYITLTSTSPFSLYSLDAGTANAYYWGGNNDQITLVGHLSGSVEVLNYIVNISAGTLWSTISLSGWNNLTSVDIYGSSFPYGSLILDNINTSIAAVPLPSAIWIFGSAVAGFGIFGRRKPV